ncbi:hypothetical protein BU17DRAFT_65235 [Hysterangium stoloniferum]|nr:hypothetical protein BU17DRAFT_65235 [Hysterangium stoloniferum]
MMRLLLLIILVTSISSLVSAQTEQGSGFDASPLQKANLAFYGIFTIAGICQLGIAVTYLFRARSPHLPPAVGGLATLIVLLLASSVSIATTIARNTYRDSQNQAVLSNKTILEFEVVGSFLIDWLDAMMLLLVALVLRDRYFTQSHTRRNIGFRSFLITFGIMLSTLTLVVVATMSTAIYNAEYGLLLDGSISREKFQKVYDLVTRLRQVFVGLYITFAFLLSIFGVVLRRHIPWDRITILTTSLILPLLCLHAVASLIFEVLNDTIVLESSFTLHTSDELDFSSTVVFYTLFLSITAVISYFFLNPKFWGISPEQTSPSSLPLGFREASSPGRTSSPSVNSGRGATEHYPMTTVT